MDIANLISCALAGSPIIDMQYSYPGNPSMTITSGRGNLIIPLSCLVFAGAGQITDPFLFPELCPM